jgi:tetratricopeptide (TPR) repeat protein
VIGIRTPSYEPRRPRRRGWTFLALCLAASLAVAGCSAKKPPPEVDSGPDPVETHFLAAESHSYAGRHHEAIAEYRKVLQLDPEMVEALYNVGNEFYRTRDYDRAAKSFENAIKVDPTHLKSYNNLGIVLTDIGQPKKAIKVLTRVTAIDPGYVKAWISLGLAYYAVEQYPKAAMTFKEALRINPESADAYTNLGNTYTVQQLYPEAVEAYRKALLLNGEDANTHYNLGTTYARMGRTNDAAIQLETLEMLDPVKADSLRRRIRLGPPL